MVDDAFGAKLEAGADQGQVRPGQLLPPQQQHRSGRVAVEHVRRPARAWPGVGLEPGQRAQDGWDEHAAFMESLADDGFILAGGMLADDRALHVVEADSEEEVLARFGADPWPAQKLNVASVTGWEVLLGGLRVSLPSTRRGTGARSGGRPPSRPTRWSPTRRRRSCRSPTARVAGRCRRPCRAEGNQVRVAVHEGDVGTVWDHLDDVAREEQPTAVPVEYLAAREGPPSRRSVIPGAT